MGIHHRRWSKLKREIYKLFSPDIDIQLHCVAYRMASQRGSFDLPRYWITLGQEAIWDYPKDFKNQSRDLDWHQKNYHILFERDLYPYGTAISDISNIIREYIDTPRPELLVKSFENDHWGLTDILRAADYRIGKTRLLMLKGRNSVVDKVINRRLREGSNKPYQGR